MQSKNCKKIIVCCSRKVKKKVYIIMIICRNVYIQVKGKYNNYGFLNNEGWFLCSCIISEWPRDGQIFRQVLG